MAWLNITDDAICDAEGVSRMTREKAGRLWPHYVEFSEHLNDCETEEEIASTVRSWLAHMGVQDYRADELIMRACDAARPVHHA